MSDVPANPGLLRQMAGRWQIPLLLVSLAATAAGIWRVRPQPKPVEFEPLYTHAMALHRAELYPEAGVYISTLLSSPERTEEQRRRLYTLLAKVTFDRERHNVVHSQDVAKRILEYSDAGLAKGATFDGPTRHMRGQVNEWLLKPWQAVAEYRAELDQGTADPWALRRRILDIRLASGDIDEETLRTECTAFVMNPGVSDAAAFWGAEQIVNILAKRKKFDEAEQFLKDEAERFQKSTEKGAYEYLQALIWFHLERRAEAERALRVLRDTLAPGDPTAARAGMLLGRILLDQQAPEYALSFFDDVIRYAPPGAYRWVAVLGRAEALDALERFTEALEAYNEAARQVSESPYESIVEMNPVSAAVTESVDNLLPKWRSPTAAAYLRIYGRRAELAFQLGKEALTRPSAISDELDQGEDKEQARRYLKQAGEHFLALSSLIILDAPGAAAATLKSADAFDMAGDRERTAEVLEGFIHKYAENMMVPEALLRLGQTYQALAQFDKAIARYQENLTLYPRTPAAIGSLVPLAECFESLGQIDKAEQTLLRLLEHTPGDALGPITPAAVHYRDALFSIADLYMGAKQFEKAVARYEEAIQRYGDDPRADRARFMLAEGYRHSALQIRKEFKGSASLPYTAELAKAHRERLEHARQLYGQIVERYSARAPESLDDSERLQLRLSHIYAADSVFEMAQLPDVPTTQPTIEALDLYEQATRACAQDPIAMSAYVQIVNCQLSLGKIDKARMAVQRARWALRNIPDTSFKDMDPKQGRAFWEDYLTWLEKTPTLTTTRPAA
jgi:tetratricopeptide (TPR) repeat protein